jgi:hypothetical protein
MIGLPTDDALAIADSFKNMSRTDTAIALMDLYNEAFIKGMNQITEIRMNQVSEVHHPSKQ